jgi:predicted CoA-binding protein
MRHTMEAKVKAAYLVLNHLSIVGDIYKAADCASLTAHEIMDTKAKDMWMGSGLDNDPQYWDEVIEEIKKHGKDK